VVGARDPQRGLAEHAVIAGEDVLDGVVERVPQVERAGDVRRRNDHREGLARALLVAAEVSALPPDAIPPLLDGAGS